LVKDHYETWGVHAVKMFAVTTDKPTEPRKSHTPRWSDVWRDGDNLFALVEKELGSPLPRNREMPELGQVSSRYRSDLHRLMGKLGFSWRFLWRELELIDAPVCADAYNVGPRTVLHWVSELGDIARANEPSPEDDGPVSLSDDVLAAIGELSVDRVVYVLYGGSLGGFARLAVDSGCNRDSVDCAEVHDHLLVSDLQDTRRVLRNMIDGLERCGHLLSTEQALRWMWDGGLLDQILEQYCAGPTRPDHYLLGEFDAAVPILRARFTDGKSIEEIARTRGRNKYEVLSQIVMWAHYVPADLCRAFQGPEDSRVYDLEPEPDPIYQYPFTPGRCLNCDEPRVTSSAPLYCSEVCRQTATTVRYVRARTRDGRIVDLDVQEAIEMRVAHILAGGYPEKARYISAQLRESVLRGARGHCQKCGRPFDGDDLDATATIQHMSGSSPERSNLQAWCRRCNMADAQSRFTPLPDDSPQSSVFEAIRTRWESPLPLRACDDDERWEANWRRYARLVKATLAFEEAPSNEPA
jgi:hypothetical protein